MQPNIAQVSTANNFLAKDRKKRSLELLSLLSNFNEPCDIDTLKNYLQNGNININYIDKDGKTALFHAFYTQQTTEIISLLLEYGANPNLQYSFRDYFSGSSKEQLTLLMMAIAFFCDAGTSKHRDQTYQIIFLLLDSNKLDFSVIDKHGDTSLMHFVKEHSSFFQKKYQFFNMPEFNENVERSKNILEKLLAITDEVNTANNNGQTPVMLATKHTNCHLLQRLISSGANLDAKDKSGDDAFIYAIKNANIDALKLIHESQPKLINQLSQDYKKQACKFALQHKSSEILNYLKSTIGMDYKEFILSTDESANNMLMIAAQSENSNIFSTMVDNFPKGNIDDQNNKGETALMQAVKMHRQNNITMLLAKGANINKPNDKGDTPALHIIKNLGFDTKNLYQTIETLQLLCKAKANLNIQDENGKTPIMIAVSGKVILDGARFKDTFSNDIPYSKNHIKCYFNLISTMLEHNPNLDITDNNNKTCSTIFLEILSKRIEEILKRVGVLRLEDGSDSARQKDNLIELRVIKTTAKPVLEKMLQLKKEALTKEESDLLSYIDKVFKEISD